MFEYQFVMTVTKSFAPRTMFRLVKTGVRKI